MPSSKRKKESNNLIYHLKELEEGETTKPKVSRREEIIKITVFGDTMKQEEGKIIIHQLDGGDMD